MNKKNILIYAPEELGEGPLPEKTDFIYMTIITLFLNLEKTNHNVFLINDETADIYSLLKGQSSGAECFPAKLDFKSFYKEKCIKVIRDPNVLVRKVDFDLILIRRDDPHPIVIKYLENISNKKGIVLANNSVVNITNRKDFCKLFDDFMPKTIYTRSFEEALEFIKEYKQAVIKPIDKCYGSDIFYIDDSTPRIEFENKFNIVQDTLKKVVIQKFIPDIQSIGSKKINIINSDDKSVVIPLFDSKPPDKTIISNFRRGGIVSYPASISQRQIKICNKIASELLKNKCYLAGVDFIGDKLIEINTINPGVLIPADALEKIGYNRAICDQIQSLTKIKKMSIFNNLYFLRNK